MQRQRHPEWFVKPMNSGPASNSFILRDTEIVPLSEPAVCLNDAAIAQGHGLFETVKAYRGRPYALPDHLARMSRGADALGFKAPALDEAAASIRRVLEANGLEDSPTCRIRLTLTGGVESPSLFYEASACPFHPERAKVITGPFVRNDRSLLAGFKTVSYGENAVATRLTKAAGADEALWSNTKDELCEGTWSNVFVRLEGRWITSPLSSGCLPGVTREKVLALAPEVGIAIGEVPIPMGSLSGIEAAFLTSSIREIQPVVSIDGRPLAESGNADMEKLKTVYTKLVASSL